MVDEPANLVRHHARKGRVWTKTPVDEEQKESQQLHLAQHIEPRTRIMYVYVPTVHFTITKTPGKSTKPQLLIQMKSFSNQKSNPKTKRQEKFSFISSSHSTIKLMQFVRTLGTVVRARVYKYVHSMCILHIRKQVLPYTVHTIRATSKLDTCVI